MIFRTAFHLCSIALNELTVNIDTTFQHFDLDDSMFHWGKSVGHLFT